MFSDFNVMEQQFWLKSAHKVLCRLALVGFCAKIVMTRRKKKGRQVSRDNAPVSLSTALSFQHSSSLHTQTATDLLDTEDTLKDWKGIKSGA